MFDVGNTQPKASLQEYTTVILETYITLLNINNKTYNKINMNYRITFYGDVFLLVLRRF